MTDKKETDVEMKDAENKEETDNKKEQSQEEKDALAFEGIKCKKGSPCLAGLLCVLLFVLGYYVY